MCLPRDSDAIRHNPWDICSSTRLLAIETVQQYGGVRLRPQPIVMRLYYLIMRDFGAMLVVKINFLCKMHYVGVINHSVIWNILHITLERLYIAVRVPSPHSPATAMARQAQRCASSIYLKETAP